MPNILAIDLGGTKTAMATYDIASFAGGERKVFPTHADQAFSHVQTDLLTQIDEMRTKDTVAIGIGVPGLVDRITGKIITMPNIPQSEGQDLAQVMRQHTGLPVTIENDVHCFALGEAIFGAGKGESVVIGTTLGTGVGGGVVIDGSLLRGSHGFAGELGHMLLVPGKPPYKTDDMRGEVEQFLSGTALGKRCSDAQSPTDYLSGAVCEFMHDSLYQEVAWYVTNLVYAFDPSVIVFGGSVGRALRPHLGKISVELDKWLLPHTPKPRLAITAIEDSALRGAACLASRSL